MGKARGKQEQEHGSGASHGSGPRRRWWLRLLSAVAVVALLAGAGVLGQQFRQGKEEKIEPPAGASGPGRLALPGEAVTPPVTVTIYQDLRSRASRAFAEEYGDTLDAMAATGQVRLEYRLVTETDARLGGRGATEAANAAACAQDEGHFTDYVDVLWRNQPDEHDDAFASQRHLSELAEQVPGIDPAVFRPCVKVRKHQGWVQASQREFSASGLGEVPVLTIGDRVVRPGSSLTPVKLRKLVRQAVRDSGLDW